MTDKLQATKTSVVGHYAPDKHLQEPRNHPRGKSLSLSAHHTSTPLSRISVSTWMKQAGRWPHAWVAGQRRRGRGKRRRYTRSRPKEALWEGNQSFSQMFWVRLFLSWIAGKFSWCVLLWVHMCRRGGRNWLNPCRVTKAAARFTHASTI
jgi:hypothetical protein